MRTIEYKVDFAIGPGGLLTVRAWRWLDPGPWRPIGKPARGRALPALVDGVARLVRAAVDVDMNAARRLGVVATFDELDVDALEAAARTGGIADSVAVVFLEVPRP